MPVLDNCIANIYEPGNIGADGGSAVVPVLPTLEDPTDYDPDAVTYSLDFTKFYNSLYAGAII